MKPNVIVAANAIAAALEAGLLADSARDVGQTPANVCDGLFAIADAIHHLAKSVDQMSKAPRK